MKKEKENAGSISSNRRAFFNYQMLEEIEAGISLLGTEIKSIRAQGCNLRESYVRIDDGEAFVCQLEIPLYKYGNILNHEPFRKRKLLLNRGQIKKIRLQMEKEHLVCIPLKMYLKKGYAKLLLGIGKSKKLTDKREGIREKDADRQISRAVKYRKNTG